jgi:precorrin-6B methylase 2
MSRFTRSRRHSHPKCLGSVALLELPTNSVVGDLGAGSGEVSLEMARQLGPASRVYGTDINAQRIVEIKEAATKASLTNVVALEGAPASTNLPEACCDALFVRGKAARADSRSTRAVVPAAA